MKITGLAIQLGNRKWRFAEDAGAPMATEQRATLVVSDERVFTESEVKAMTPMKWISVEDKLPPPMTLVLALVQYDTTPIIAELRPFKEGPVMWWATCPEYGEINGDAYWYGGFESVSTMVTHWMPLPSPPNT